MSEASRSFEQTDSPSGTRARSGVRLAALFVLLFSAVPIAVAESPGRLLDAPRAAGLVGERYDGFAVVRSPASPETTALVDKVNAERRAVYTQRAQSEGVPIEAIGRIYAGEIIKAAPAGTWFLGENGEWSRK